MKRHKDELEIEQVHEDWRKGTYEYYLTRKAFIAAEEIANAKKYPLLRYSVRAIAAVSSFLDVLVTGGGKNLKKIEELQRKLERLYLLCQKGLIQLNIKYNGATYVLRWITSSNPYRTEDLENKQIIPLIVGDIFKKAMELAQGMGYFIQKPFEVRRGIDGLAESLNVPLEESELEDEE